MSASPIRVLLIEDNPGDALLVAETLSDAPRGPFALTHAETVGDGLALLGRQPFDVVLLDLTLPDSQGVETLRQVRAGAPSVPVVVMTVTGNEQQALEMLKLGAQDYLFKGRVGSELLSRALRYSIERQRLLGELQRMRQQEQSDRDASEMEAVARLSHTGRASVTAGLYGASSLSESQPELFAALVQRYCGLLERCLERRAYRVEINVSDSLRALADQLGFLRAGPRDVVELHTLALRQQVAGATAQRVQVYVEEGRLLILELMGYVAAHYRNQALGLQRRRGVAETAASNEERDDA